MTDNVNIKILIAYDQSLVAEGLAALLSKQKDLSVIEVFENNSVLNLKLEEYDADILIVELSSWVIQHFEYIKTIHNSYPALKLLILSELIEHRQLEELMPHIHGYILKTCSSEKVFFAIREIFGSGKYLCSKAIDVYFRNENDKQTELDLTSREKEILTGWLTTKNNNELAMQLNISQSTVRTHLKNIRQKLGDVNHIQLMNYACRENILKGKFKPICNNCRSFCKKVEMSFFIPALCFFV